jgi:eukaryotic-like serine/threonine-protein kinase
VPAAARTDRRVYYSKERRWSCKIEQRRNSPGVGMAIELNHPFGNALSTLWGYTNSRITVRTPPRGGFVRGATLFSTVDVGTTIAGKYVLTRKLGEGGMGAVYEAQHTVIGRRFAVKFLRPELAGQNDMLARFRREAQAAGSLDSNHVVAVVDFGVEGALPYMVMEFLKGQELRTLIAQTGRLAVERAVDFAIQTCRGLAAAHAKDIVHRDLKPENIFIAQHNGGELLKILDFGVAKLRGNVATGLITKPGSMLGTLYYMPPEQVRGDQTIDQRADIYALGAILYECLTNRYPHPGIDAETILYHIMHQPIVRLETLRQDLPEELVSIVHKSLAYEPSLRYRTAEEFGARLLPFAGRSLPAFDIHELARDQNAHAGSVSSERDTQGTLPPRSSNLPGRTTSSQLTEPDMRHSGFGPTASSVGPSGTRQLLNSTYARASALILALVSIASVAMVFGRTASEASTNDPLAPVVPAMRSAIGSSTFEVSVAVSPAFATLTLDGQRVGVGRYKATLPVDGREHTLELEADGFIPRTIAFVDRLPLRHVALVKLAPAAAPSA